VELHGGTVRAESAGTGEGSSFIVNLPLATAEGGLENSFYGQNSFPRRVPSFGGRKVLVIDDELDARELIKRILVRCNTGVITAANAEEGLEILKMERPDLIISDIGMPGKNGYQFMLEVRKLSMEDGGQTPAIALTAFARPDDARKALDAGYQKHLSKPVDAHALINIITDLIGRQRETGE
jgi:CheY-like chemotaxis protein